MLKYLKKGMSTVLLSAIIASMCNLSFLDNSFAENTESTQKYQISSEVETSNTSSSIKKTGKTTAVLNVRKGPSTKYAKLGKLSKGAKVQIISNASNGWYKIKYKGKYGYVAKKYIKLDKNIVDKAVNKTGKTITVLNVRKGPSTKYSKLGKLSKGTEVQIIAINESTGWYKIKYKGTYGYISNQYVNINTEPDKPVNPDKPSKPDTTYDSYIKNTLIPKYGIANLSKKSISGRLDNKILLSSGISDISFRDLNGDSQKEMIVTIKTTDTKNNYDKYRVEVYTISGNSVTKLGGDIEDFYVLATGTNNNHNFNVFTKKYNSEEYLFVENYVTGYGEGGNINNLYMYKMVGNNIVMQRDFWTSISYVAQEPDYVGMNYIEIDKNGKSIYGIPSKGGYNINNFDKQSCRVDFDRKVNARMSSFDLSGIWKNYMQNYHKTFDTSKKYYINTMMKQASLRQSGVTDLFRMEYMPNSASSGTVSFYNYNGNYLNNFK